MPKPTHTDAELILKLYDARRESEIRKARQWWTSTFWPESADDIVKIMRAGGTQENAWFRQVLGYWGIAGSFVAHGVLSEDLFFEPSFAGEMFFIFAKLDPFLAEIRQKTQNPSFLLAIEKLVKSDAAKDRYAATARNVENARKARAESLAARSN